MASVSPDPFELVFFTAQSGALSARLDREDGTLVHLHSLVDPEKEAAFFSDLQFWGDRIVLAGCGLGYHLKRAIESIKDETRLLVLEYYDELASRCLELFPLEVRGRVKVVSRSDGFANETILRFLDGGRYIQIVKHPPSYRAHREYYRSHLSVLSGKRSAPRPPEKVLVMQGDFFLEKELSSASGSDTATVIPFHYKKWETVTAYESELQKQFQTDRPGAVISINMLGFDGNGILPEYCRRAGIPLLIWFVDDPRPILLNQKRYITDEMIAFSWERAYLPWLQQQGFGSARYLPLATEPGQFEKNNASVNTVRCGFVGTAMGSSFLEEISVKFLWKPEYAPLAADVAGRMLCGEHGEVDRLIDDECSRRSIVLPSDGEHTRTWLRSYVLHTASMMKRKRLITGLQPHGIETFGDPDGWRELCGLQIITHPDVDYCTGVADCYRSVTVNLNSTSCQMPTALNQRVFDVPESGAFILNDNQADLRELFAGDEYVVYESIEDCIEKTEYFFRNERARKEISAAARRRIHNEHTYVHRLRTLISAC